MDFFEIFALIMGTAWAFFRASSWVILKRNADLERLYEALEIGVSHAWTTVIKPWLEKNDTGGKLPVAIREHAERVAIEEATRTDSIVKRYPCNVIRATLKMAVEEAKRRGAK